MEDPDKSVPKVMGVDLDGQTRCKHWNSTRDIIAIKFACCQTYYACYDCHQELAGHAPSRWPKENFQLEKVVLCGSCKNEMSIQTYQKANSQCPQCGAAFNPRCALHWPLYFASI